MQCSSNVLKISFSGINAVFRSHLGTVRLSSLQLQRIQFTALLILDACVQRKAESRSVANIDAVLERREADDERPTRNLNRGRRRCRTHTYVEGHKDRDFKSVANSRYLQKHIRHFRMFRRPALRLKQRRRTHKNA